MKNTLLTLLKLVEIDNKIDQILEEQKEIPESVINAKSEIEKLELQLSQLVSEIENTQTLKKTIESFLSEKREWAQQREERINDLSTQKEFQAAQKEIATTKKEIKDKETELSALLPKLEQLLSDHKSTKEKSEPKIAELNQYIADNQARLDKINELVGNQNKERQVALNEVTDKQILAHYELIHTRISPAMAHADNGNCSECGTRILPQTLNRLGVGKEMYTCSRCKRILYLQDMLMPK